MKLTDMQAINYAVDVWHVDIISMSCGFTESSERIQRAIDHASAEKVLIVAAAGNGRLVLACKRKLRARYDCCTRGRR
jgi:phage terminase large subunit